MLFGSIVFIIFVHYYYAIFIQEQNQRCFDTTWSLDKWCHIKSKEKRNIFLQIVIFFLIQSTNSRLVMETSYIRPTAVCSSHAGLMRVGNSTYITKLLCSYMRVFSRCSAPNSSEIRALIRSCDTLLETWLDQRLPWFFCCCERYENFLLKII